MLAWLERREISAVELLDLHLERIEAVNPKLNAIVTSDFERARARARSADAPRGGSRPRRLLGLPFTVKDCVDVEGLPTTSGVPERADEIAEAHNEAVARVLDAGGVLLGKTNVPEYAGDWQTDNRVFGRTQNPWDLARTPGGSTGGGAAAVAAGLSPFELGSDSAGSIRVPAAFCGVFGHRPSRSIVPRHRHVPGTPWPNPAATLLVVGPLARTVADLELALDSIAGPAAGDEVGWRLELPPPRRAEPAGLRVALLPSPRWLPVDAEIEQAVEVAGRALAADGAIVGEAHPDGFDLRRHEEVFAALLAATTFCHVRGELRSRIESSLRESLDEFAEARLRGFRATSYEYFDLLGEADEFRRMWSGFFRDWDVVLMPCTISNAFQHLSDPFPERRLTIEGGSVQYARLQVHSGIAAASGLPSAAVPAASTATGLPIGIQVMGPQLEDRTVLAVAGMLERLLGGYRRPPI